MEVLNEVYIGRAPVKPLQDQIRNIREKLSDKPYTTSINLDTEILKFNRIAEKVFGYKTFCLYIVNNNVPNAAAFNVDIFMDKEEKESIHKALIASPEGFKYNQAFQKIDFIMNLNSGLIFNNEFTDEEVMADILHEIGHSFFLAMISDDSDYTTSRKLTSALLSINRMAMDKIRKGKFITSDIIEKDLSSIGRYISGLKDKFSKLLHKPFRESMFDNLKKNRIDYTNEKFADTFAAMYGYSKEVHSADIKTFKLVHDDYRGVKTYPKIVETVLMYRMYIKDLVAFTLNKQNEHPEELARIATTAAYIKKELSRDVIDPKMKRELQSQLDDVNQLIKDYINFPKDQDSMRILRLYHIKLYEKFMGDRREQDTDNDALFDLMDNKYNRLIGKDE